jgi:hypothetical protein
VSYNGYCVLVLFTVQEWVALGKWI